MEIIKKGADWRERDRAETILLLAAGYSVQAVAEQQRLCREAVRVRRRKWLKSGLASLPESYSQIWCMAVLNQAAICCSSANSVGG